MKVGFVGAGSMAAAMARGWAGAEGGPEAMLFSDSGSGRAATLADELGGEEIDTLTELGREADLVVVAVKPNALASAAGGLAGSAKAVISVLGATPLGRLEAAFPATPMVRTMPNLAVEVRRGVICHAPIAVPAPLGAEVLDLLGLLGRTVEVDEDLLDAATAVMGCSPAYFALTAEALAEAGADQGLDPELARELVVETLAGTGVLLATRHPADLRDAVASPGGSTEAGLEALVEAGAKQALDGAVKASMERMRS
ncbi:MAG: pyrroline-5-carboxylate reductase [Solirubrobacterales bacterium]